MIRVEMGIMSWMMMLFVCSKSPAASLLGWYQISILVQISYWSRTGVKMIVTRIRLCLLLQWIVRGLMGNSWGLSKLPVGKGSSVLWCDKWWFIPKASACPTQKSKLCGWSWYTTYMLIWYYTSLKWCFLCLNTSRWDVMIVIPPLAGLRRCRKPLIG